MNRFISNIAKKDKDKAIFVKRLVSSWYFIMLPFAILIAIKIYSGSILDIILVSDWSIASFIIYGQLISQITASSISIKHITDHGLEYYVTKRIAFGLTSNIVVYILISLKPNIYLGLTQFLLFVFANIRYFSDNIAIYDLKKQR
ncbi:MULTISPECIES: hypothetical protein [Enterobacter cloacae complex]|uniref:Polysaccharide biosynthesis protein n=1 Tax=Enterobacter ludwigii TaxID=299767 RepID=A0AAX3LDR9_9ENTR|nr:MULTISPECIES: hypothetical protein [Enterobacter cloacae complex]KUQ42525.1 hypothetical protein AWI16_04885 [Enterobacter ludwigii]MBS0844852.1 hypothetical protein [Enterobacter asburiae]MBX8911253.1 hypothetical protein [Enterobacter ludwigii]MCM7781750.1 hypothetical protein [Enterobacter ludwigii]MDH1544722.1 hypothetical protein [Enterobacter ludwigii]